MQAKGNSPVEACLLLLISAMESCVRKKKSALGIRLVMLVVVAALQLHGMERWAALSQIESGDNDKAVGPAGEISRYQIKPEVWRRYAESDADWQDPEASLAVAREVMRERCTDF